MLSNNLRIDRASIGALGIVLAGLFISGCCSRSCGGLIGQFRNRCGSSRLQGSIKICAHLSRGSDAEVGRAAPCQNSGQTALPDTNTSPETPAPPTGDIAPAKEPQSSLKPDAKMQLQQQVERERLSDSAHFQDRSLGEPNVKSLPLAAAQAARGESSTDRQDSPRVGRVESKPSIDDLPPFTNQLRSKENADGTQAVPQLNNPVALTGTETDAAIRARRPERDVTLRAVAVFPYRHAESSPLSPSEWSPPKIAGRQLGPGEIARMPGGTAGITPSQIADYAIEAAPGSRLMLLNGQGVTHGEATPRLRATAVLPSSSSDDRPLQMAEVPDAVQQQQNSKEPISFSPLPRRAPTPDSNTSSAKDPVIE